MMISLLHLSLLMASIAASFAQVSSSTTSLEGRLEFPDKSPFNITTRITLNSGEYTTYSRTDGSFVIFNVPPGVHQLDVHSSQYHFGQVKIQVLPETIEDKTAPPKCLEYAYPGAPKQATKYPLVLTPHATYQYFEQRKGFSIFGLLKNPMVIMMVVSVGMMVMMPKMMEGLDPAEKEQMRKQMKAQQNPTQMLSQMWGEFTGGDAAAAGADGTKSKRRRPKKD